MRVTMLLSNILCDKWITNSIFEVFVIIVEWRTEDHPQSAQDIHVEEQGDGEWSFYFNFNAVFHGLRLFT